jgi:hypothetical protein
MLFPSDGAQNGHHGRKIAILDEFSPPISAGAAATKGRHINQGVLLSNVSSNKQLTWGHWATGRAIFFLGGKSQVVILVLLRYNDDEGKGQVVPLGGTVYIHPWESPWCPLARRNTPSGTTSTIVVSVAATKL